MASGDAEARKVPSQLPEQLLTSLEPLEAGVLLQLLGITLVSSVAFCVVVVGIVLFSSL